MPSHQDMNRIRRLSTKLLEEFPDRFSSDYEKNKEVLAEIALIRNKQLRNEIAGYITARLTETKVEEEETEKEITE
ncbi:MAG: 30S ribosomal protein S17e [Nitrososphaerales archaeon]